MPDCEFSEDHFEDNLLVELRERYGAGLPHFKPSRVIEPDLGFDFAVATDYFPRWRDGVMVNDPRLQALMPVHRRAFLSGAFVTSFIQCKVPTLLTRGRAPLAAHYNYWGTPVFRFEIEEEQNRRLALVEQTFQADALVRYGAPCFSTLVDSDTYCYAGQIAARTHFVSPGRLAGHHHYTYLSPIRRGRAFSDPEDVDPEPLVTGVVGALERQQDQTWAHYVSRVWEVLSKSATELRFDFAPASFVEIARRLLPQVSDLPLDPFGIFHGEVPRAWPDDSGAEPTLGSYVSAVVGVELLTRDFLNSSARVFVTRLRR